MGKTRFGIEAVKQLIVYAKSEKLGNPGLMNALQKCLDRNTNLHVTFANGTSFSKKVEQPMHDPLVSLAARILYCYFQPEIEFGQFLTVQYGIGKILPSLTVQVAIQCIRAKLGLAAKEQLCVYLNIDEFSECVSFSDQKIDRGQPKFFHDMVDGVMELMRAKQNTLMFVLWTGTAFDAMSNYGVSSKHTIVEIQLPLLSDVDIFGDFSNLEDFPGLLDELARDQEFSYLQYWFKCCSFRRGLNDAGGLARGVEFILYETHIAAYGGSLSPSKVHLPPKEVATLNMGDILRKAHDRIDEKYKVMTRAGPYALTLLQDTLLCNSIFRNQIAKADVNIATQLTYEQLEAYGAVVLTDSYRNKAKSTTVELPFIWLRWLVLKAGQTYSYLSQWGIFQDPCAKFYPEDWERFNGEYTVLRNNLLATGEKKVASLQQLFPGAICKPSLMDIQVDLRQLSFVETREQFLISTLSPTDQVNAQPVEWRDLSKVLKPAANERSFDLVVMWKLADNTGHIILFMQCRWTNSTTKRNVALSKEVLASLYASSLGILSAAAAKCKDSGEEQAYSIFQTCRVLFCVITPKPYTDDVPDSCFVVSKGQFEQYFGRAFFSRAVFDIGMCDACLCESILQ